jgi:uncharacterized pyridoxamine 5'-phosphate oxidase family protein
VTYFDDACNLLKEQMGRDVAISLATCVENDISVRTVDGYYKDGAIYVLTHASSRKMRDIDKNPRVAVCRHLMQATGMGRNLGNPKEDWNRQLTPELKRVFSLFYDKHVNEADPGTCILKIVLIRAVVFGGDCKYAVDFSEHSAVKYPFQNDIKDPEDLRK